ncbi:IS1595 family transposase [Candidatus Roizmanbacteria bacterium]|nr:IS1595 family transposase [Candidatus Roizmanbacteria bacterium]
MEPRFTLSCFLKHYSTDDKCLAEIVRVKYPNGIKCKKCKEITSHFKIKGRKQYACQNCGTHVAPLSGTVFEKSTTPLTLWFYAMFLMIKTKSGVSAKQLERELGVTYKTAWRVFKQIRILMADQDLIPLDGDVEIDETFIGGKGINRMKTRFDDKPKQVVMGMVKRNGKAYLKHIENTGKWALIEQINKYVSPNARVITDEYGGYFQLRKLGYNHYSVNHKSNFKVGDIYTQNAENVWSHLKRGIFGVYRHVSAKHLQAYVNEFAFRYNNRKKNNEMFYILLKQVALVKQVS